MFFVSIASATYIHTSCSYLKPLDHHLKLWHNSVNNDNNFPDKATSTVPLQQPFHILKLFPSCSTISRYIHLPLHYNDNTMKMNVSLDTANIDAINFSTPDFSIWQKFKRNWTTPHLQRLTNVPEVPVKQVYKYMINTHELVHSFIFNKDDDKDPSWYGQS